MPCTESGHSCCWKHCPQYQSIVDKGSKSILSRSALKYLCQTMVTWATISSFQDLIKPAVPGPWDPNNGLAHNQGSTVPLWLGSQRQRYSAAWSQEKDHARLWDDAKVQLKQPNLAESTLVILQWWTVLQVPVLHTFICSPFHPNWASVSKSHTSAFNVSWYVHWWYVTASAAGSDSQS